MAELRSIIVFHGRHFVRHLGICNRNSFNLLHIMSGVVSRIKKNRRLYLKPFSGVHKRGIHTDTQTHRHTVTQTHRHTHTHDDSIRRNAMRCISPKNPLKARCQNVRHRHRGGQRYSRRCHCCRRHRARFGHDVSAKNEQPCRHA